MNVTADGTRDVQGEPVTLRRVVLTGPWEVVHDADQVR